MGILFVLVFWGAAGTALAVVGAVVARSAAAFLTRGVKEGSARAIKAATLFPFACLAWAVVVFLCQGFVNETVFHRDIGLGDSWHCPLPNGYALLLMDKPDFGTVYNPKTQTSEDSVVDQEDAPSGVRVLQVTGPYIFGGSDSKYFEHFGQSSPYLDRYFLLNTLTGKRTDFLTDDALRTSALELGIPLTLEPIYRVYSRYRFTWFDLVAVFTLFLPPMISGGLLVRSIMRLRKTSETFL